MDSRARQVRNSADAVHRTIATMIAGHNRRSVRAILRDTEELWPDPMQKKGEKWLRDTVERPGIRSYINKLKGRRRFVSIMRRTMCVRNSTVLN